MAVSQWMFCAAVLLLLIQGLQCSPVPPACPEPCLCQKDLLNCSFAGLSQAQQHVPSTVTELDLSHNLLKSITPSWPSWGLKNLWLGHNSITHLSLCVGRTWRGKHGRIPLSHNRGRCVSWAPALQLLSAERNQLEMIPEGESHTHSNTSGIASLYYKCSYTNHRLLCLTHIQVTDKLMETLE